MAVKVAINGFGRIGRLAFRQMFNAEGYEVVDLPKSKRTVTEDKEISYSYIVEKTDKKVTVTSQYKIASADYPKEYYPAFKQIWKTISDSENQVMSLIKK